MPPEARAVLVAIGLQHARQPLLFELVAERGEKPVLVEGLHQEVLRPRLHRLHRAADRAMRRHHHEARRAFLRARLAQHVEAVHVRQLKVEKHYFRLALADGGERLGAARDGVDAEVGRAEIREVELHLHDAVLDDQDRKAIGVRTGIPPLVQGGALPCFCFAGLCCGLDRFGKDGQGTREARGMAMLFACEITVNECDLNREMRPVWLPVQQQRDVHDIQKNTRSWSACLRACGVVLPARPAAAPANWRCRPETSF